MATSTLQLSHKTGLTFISQILYQITRLIVGLVTTPILIRGLGGEMYGAWVMLQQSIGYLSLSDLRPMGALKLALSVTQHEEDLEEKRRQIGAALVIWAFSFPLFIIIGIIAVVKVPLFIHVAPGNVIFVQIAIAIVIFSIAVEKLFSLPANVLRGMNQEYQAMGLNALTVILNGGIVVAAIWLDFGLPGVAGASVVGIMISGIIRLSVARKKLEWFGCAKPTRIELIKFTKMSGWLACSSLGSLLVSSSDILLVGFVLGPVVASVYATTNAVLKMTMEPLAQLIGSANSGISGVCGKGDWGHVATIRSEMFTFAVPCIVIFAVVILAINKTFVGIWVGAEFYGGAVMNLLLVGCAIIKVFFRIDNIFVASMLELKRMTFSFFFAGIGVVVVGWLLLSTWGAAAMAFTSLLGYAFQWFFYQKIIQNRAAISAKPFLLSLCRQAILSAPLFFVAYKFEQMVKINGLIEFIVYTIALVALSSCYVWFLLVSRKEQKIILSRIGRVVRQYPRVSEKTGIS